jgi:tetratricopeptide (TPR) repeat protein
VQYEVMREVEPGRLVARDLRHGRLVAIRVGPGAAAEARAIAALSHPAIPPLYDSGAWSDGAPFLVTRLVEGAPLARLGGEPAELLPHVTRAAEALAHAHRQGAVHGRLDGDAILVGRFGDTVVDGWGRAEPGADARCDVLALGALAGQLLDPAPPELAAIIARAADPDPARRYPDGAELAADFARYAAGQRVAAHRYSAGERLVRFVRRHRLVAATVALVVVGAGIVGGISLIRIVAEERRARAAEQAARAARTEALAQADAAEGLAGALLGDLRAPLAGAGRLEVLAGAASAVERYVAAIAGTPEGARTRPRGLLVEALEARASLGRLAPAAALPLLSIAVDVAARDPGLGHELASASFERANVELSLKGFVAQAERDIGRAVEILERDPGDDRGAELLIRARATQAAIASQRGDSELERRARRAARDGVRALLVRRPDDRELLMALARAELVYGQFLVVRRRYDEALPELRAAGDAYRRLIAAAPADRALEMSASSVEQLEGVTYLMRGQAAAARDVYAHCLEVRTRAVLGDPTNAKWRRAIGNCRSGIAEASVELGDVDTARRILQGDVDAARAALAASPEDNSRLVDLAQKEAELCGDLCQLGRTREARAGCAQAQADILRLQAAEGRVMWRSLLDAVDIKVAQGELAEGRLDAAADPAARALATTAAIVRGNPNDELFLSELADARAVSGRIALARGDVARARGLLAAAVALYAELVLRIGDADAMLASDEAEARLAFAATLPPAAAREQVARALATFEALAARGRLTPVRAGRLEEARRAAAKLVR